ncbi:MAG: deoxyribose-phosphate aldolase [Acidobacteriota bacterium]|nr:deoxyribose-phosphate aldolase [Blastocatellia bacterium]MDW8411074.1 deoxyribose-phosphate aldolase [Acidobacteriota bacterium]
MVNAGAARITLPPLDSLSARDMAQFIDHTLLKPEACREDIRKLCSEALEHRFASVCVNPIWVKEAARILCGSGVEVCTVIGFPFGATPTDVKVYEARRCIFNGATEIDMVLQIGNLKSGDYDQVEEDIYQVANACHQEGALLKVIIETALLTDEEKVKASLLCRSAGADYVKTSTGFSKGGATVRDVALMRRVVGPEMGVKAAGGVKDFASAKEMLAAGATRIGASVGVKIVQGQSATASY